MCCLTLACPAPEMGSGWLQLLTSKLGTCGPPYCTTATRLGAAWRATIRAMSPSALVIVGVGRRQKRQVGCFDLVLLSHQS